MLNVIDLGSLFSKDNAQRMWSNVCKLFVAKKTGYDLMSAEQAAKLGAISEDAKKVEASETNGNIKIDGTETKVYDDTDVTTNIKANTDALDVINSTDVTKEGSLAKVANDASIAASNEKTRAEAAEKALADDLGTASTEEEQATGLHAAVEANAAAIGVINGTGAGSIAKAVADEVTARDLAIATAIANTEKGAFERVSAKPTKEEAKFGVIYLVKDETVKGEDKFAEYVKIAVGDDYDVVKIGDTSLDLSNYVQLSDMQYMTEEEVDAMCVLPGAAA